MRHISYISLVALILSCAQAFAQAPQGINYQGVARGLDGQPLSQKEITIRISILNGSAEGELEYDEIHEVKTNSFGLFTLVIGEGESGTSDFSFIGWTSGKKWLQIEMDENGGRNFKLMGSQQLMSVPYALYAERSGNGYQAGQGITISNNMISNAGDGDNDATNELISSVALGADNKLRITDAGGTKEADLSGLLGASQNLSNVLAQGNSAGNATITNLGSPVSGSDAATKTYVDAHADGDSNSSNEIQDLTQVLAIGADANGSKISNLGTPTADTDAATKLYVDNLDATDGDKSASNEIQTLSKVGSSIALSSGGGSVVLGDDSSTNELQTINQVLSQGNDAGGIKIVNIGAPTIGSDAATKLYVDILDIADGDKSATNEIQNINQVLAQGNDAGGAKITNLGAPAVNSDATTKLYVDNLDATDGDKNSTNEIQNISQVLAQGNDAGGAKITNLGAPAVNSDATTKLYVDNLDATDGDKNSTNEIQNISQVLTQGNNAGGTKITNLGAPTINSDAATKLYVDNLDAADGDKNATNEIQNLSQVLTQNNSAGGSTISNLADPGTAQDAATKNYVDLADAVLSSKLSNTFAFKANFLLNNLSGATQNNIEIPIISQDFVDFAVIVGNEFIAPEDGVYIFIVEGNFNGANTGGRISISANGTKLNIPISSPYKFGASPIFTGTYIFKLSAFQIVKLVGDNVFDTEQFTGRFSGFKL